jgi:hypothetical protein
MRAKFNSVDEVISALTQRRQSLFFQIKRVDALLIAAQRMKTSGGNPVLGKQLALRARKLPAVGGEAS